MSGDTWGFLGVVLAALFSAGGVVYTVKNSAKQTKTNVTQQIIDQLQEERDKVQERLDKMERDSKAEIAELRDKVDRMARENMRLRDFVQELRNDIRVGVDPPPRPWPAELTDG